MSRPVASLALRDTRLRDDLFPPQLIERLHRLVDCDVDTVIADFIDPELDLSRTEVLITGWGCPRINGPVLDRLPSLRLIAHVAGTVKGHLDPACWRRGIEITTATAANAVPVAEFTVAQIVLANKAVGASARHYAQHRDRSWSTAAPQPVGNYGRTVGIIGASTIGRMVLERLRDFDLEIVLADPTLDRATAAELGADLLPLDELMAASDVVSLHAPVLPGTVGMIGSRQLSVMKDGATFINTARGVLVDHDALRAELVAGRIDAVLDVTDPEPLPVDDPLFDLPNVQLTPHIAGSMGTELVRMSTLILGEVERFVAGQPLQYGISESDLSRIA